MRRILFLVLLAASLLPLPGPARAQATADQLNKLSLEALTARPSGGTGGYAPRTTRPTYHRTYRRYARPRRFYARHYAPARRGTYRSTRSYRHYVPPRSYGNHRAAPHSRTYRAPAYHRPYRR